jgi:3-methyladenine DNA glycosylase/8-oxoguanine DNA glycosylase
LGLQKLIGFYLGDGKRMTARQVREAMVPFAPYRGIAAFYMMVYYRLHHARP